MRIFISKDQHEVSELLEFTSKHGYSLDCHSFLHFEAVDSNCTTEFDVIFFSSPRAVQFYLDNNFIPSKSLVACIGSSTEQSLLERQVQVDFVGTSSDPKQVSVDLKKWLGDKRILIPHSNKSKFTITSSLDTTQVIKCLVYTTVITAAQVDQSDIYIFSSPSNVEGFLKDNHLDNKKVVIAYGTTTQQYLKENGISSIVPKESTLGSIIELIQSIEQ